MERDPIGNDARRAARERVLGERPVCVRCGIAEFDVLLPVKRRLLQEHHLGGRAHDAQLTWPLCANCHLWITERLAEAGVSMREQPDELARTVHWFRGISVALRMLAEACTRRADALTEAQHQQASPPPSRDDPKEAA